MKINLCKNVYMVLNKIRKKAKKKLLFNKDRNYSLFLLLGKCILKKIHYSKDIYMNVLTMQILHKCLFQSKMYLIIKEIIFLLIYHLYKIQDI